MKNGRQRLWRRKSSFVLMAGAGMFAGAVGVGSFLWTEQRFPQCSFLESQDISLPLLLLLFACGATVVFFHALKNSLRYWINHVVFRPLYDPEKVLEETSSFLTSTLARDDILTYIWNTISHTLGVAKGAIFLRTTDKKHSGF